MLWIKTVIHTTTAGIEPVSGILLIAGINGYEVQDSEDFNSFLENKEVYFDYIEDDLMKLKDCETTVTFYVPENTQGLETIISVKNEMARLKSEDADGSFGSLEVTSDTKLEEQDWENNWKQYFKPFPVGKRLTIKPTWEEIEKDDGRIVVEIDPSSSFGTGSHTTTRLCLEKAEEYVKGGEEILDMGCGSGILGIAALKMGARHVTAVDIDQNSTRIAAENYAVNHLPEESFDVYAGNILDGGELRDEVASRKYDIILANIVADVIMWMAPSFEEFLAEDGKLVVSGIIADRSGEVISALEKQHFKVIDFTEKEDWAVVVLCHDSL